MAGGEAPVGPVEEIVAGLFAELTGAVAAGLYAAGLPAERIREIVLSWKFRRSFLSRTPWLWQYLKNTFANNSLKNNIY